MEDILTRVRESADHLKQYHFEEASFGVILGTGLDALPKKIDILYSLPYKDIPHFPVSTVEFHKGQLLLGNLHGRKIIIMQGRFHYYEGYSMQQITFPVRVMKALGVAVLLLSNAAGGLHPDFRKGELVVADDHINLLPENPLRGLSDPALGNRFVDMSRPYDPALIKLLHEVATQLNIQLKKGVYAAVAGPNLETRAEYRWLRSIGADMVGMSTVPEVIVANQLGMRCAAVSVITDECDPDNLQPVNIEDIIAVAAKADDGLSELLMGVLKSL